MYSVSPWVVWRGCLLWPVHSLGKILLTFALLHFVLQDQTCLLLKVSLDFLLLHSSPLWWKGYLLWGGGVVSKGLLVFTEPFSFSFFGIRGSGIELDYCDIAWFALKMNRNHSVIFEIAPRYFILDFFVDYEGSSIYSQEFSPTVVNLMINCIKFAHSSPF